MSLKKARWLIWRSLAKETTEATLKQFSLARWKSFLGSFSLVDIATNPDLYSVFTFEPLHNLFLGISKLTKHFMIQYLSSNTLSTNSNGPKKNQRMFSSVKTGVLQWSMIQFGAVWVSKVLYYARNECAFLQTWGLRTTQWNIPSYRLERNVKRKGLQGLVYCILIPFWLCWNWDGASEWRLLDPYPRPLHFYG